MKEYKIPTSGHYYISAQTYTYKPTGRFKKIKNPDKKWWQFWKEETIDQEVFETVVAHTGKQVRVLQAGETVQSFWPPKKL
jgi:hypothetical protein